MCYRLFIYTRSMLLVYAMALAMYGICVYTIYTIYNYNGLPTVHIYWVYAISICYGISYVRYMYIY
jgi:hypothetical protein